MEHKSNNKYYQKLFKDGTFEKSQLKAIYVIINDFEFYQVQLETLGKKYKFSKLSNEDIFGYFEEPDRLYYKSIGFQLYRKHGLLVLDNSYDFNSIKWNYEFLNDMGYDIEMIFIRESLNNLQKVNNMKAFRKSVKDLEKEYKQILDCKFKLQSYLKSEQLHFVYNNGFIRDNNLSLAYSNFNYIDKKIRKFINKPIKNPLSKIWIDEELDRQKDSIL